MAADRKRRACEIGRERYALTVPRVQRLNAAPFDPMCLVAKFSVGVPVWAYNTAVSFRQVAKTYTDAKVLKVKLSLN